MSLVFDNPLWLLAIPPLVALALWLARRARRRPIPVTTHLLFRRALEEVPSRPPRGRGRPPLALLPLFLLLLALAGPAWRRASSEPGVLLVIDGSASMAARNVQGRTREELARRRFLREGGRARRELRHRGEAGLRGTPEEVFAAALRGAEGTPVHVLTDGLPPGALPGGGALGHTVVAATRGNAGITALATGAEGDLVVRAEGGEGHGKRALVLVRHGRTRREEFARHRLPGGAFSVRHRVAFAPAAGDRGIAARLEGTADALDLDDAAYLAEGGAAATVVLPPLGAESFARALAASGVEHRVHGAGRGGLAIGGAGEAPRRWWRPGDRLPGLRDLGPPRPRRGLLEGRGALARIGGERLELEAVFPLEPPPDPADVLLALDGAPLVVRAGEDLIFLADPDRGDWARDPSFPLAVAHLLDAGLGPRRSLSVRGVGSVPPPGDWERLSGPGPAPLSAGLAPGLYRAAGAEGASDRHLAVALLAPEETRAAARVGPPRHRAVSTVAGRERRRIEFRAYCIGGAALASLLLALRTPPGARGWRGLLRRRAAHT